MNLRSFFIALTVSLGGFLFGFDAGIISGVMEYAGPYFQLDDVQTGWAVSCTVFIAMFAMLVAGRLSDTFGRKPVLLTVAFLYAISAILSALASSYEMLYIARMIGGVAFGAALVIAPTSIADIAGAKDRGKLVSIQQLNIVLGFFAAFLSNYLFNHLTTEGAGIFFQSGSFAGETVWRWMLGVEALPALLYFGCLFLVPRSPRWLLANGRETEGERVLAKIHGTENAQSESADIRKSLAEERLVAGSRISDLFLPALRFILIVGIVIGILQQATGINAVYFYATQIFKQTGVGVDNAFLQGVLLSLTSVVFATIAILTIDRIGRRPLLLVGIAGIAICMLLCGFGFQGATYQLTPEKIAALEGVDLAKLSAVENKTFTSDVAFKNTMREVLGTEAYSKQEGAILEAATNMNATIVLVGILGFIACFNFSLGPVMWVMLSEMYPNRIRGLAIGSIGLINSFTAWIVTQIFPWELSNLGAAPSFFIFGGIALVGFFILFRILPETKGKTLEQLEADLVRT